MSPITDGAGMTPDQLFQRFGEGDREKSQEALRAFKSLASKQRFLGPALEFFQDDKDDQVRSWGAGVLESLGGSKAFACLLAIFTGNETSELKHNYRYTRFFALAALARLERSPTASIDFHATRSHRGGHTSQFAGTPGHRYIHRARRLLAPDVHRLAERTAG